MTNLCEEYDKFLSENDEHFKQLSKENQFYINATGYVVKYYDLQQRIDKAIEYIENNSYGFNTKYVTDEFETNVLLDILKGSDSNEL